MMNTMTKWKFQVSMLFLLLATVVSTTHGVQAIEKWGNNEEIPLSNRKYVLTNSQWGRGSLSGSDYWQKIWWNSDTDFGVDWHCPSSGDPRVKGYPAVRMGRKWKNNSLYTSNSGLPVQVSWNKNIWSDFGYTLSNYYGQFNVAYDCWFYGSGGTGGDIGDYKAELMIWTAPYYANPFGNKVGNVNLNGRNWDVYYGYAQNFDGNGDNWDVYSFVKTGSWLTDTGGSALNIKDFTNYCRDSIPNVTRLSNNYWLQTVDFGVEPRLGDGKLRIWKWRCDVTN